MSATRENVLATIVQYVEDNKRRAPAKEIATIVGDTVQNVQAVIKSLVGEGAINSSRGRNGGALPDGVTLPKKDKPAKQAVEATPAVDAAADAATGEDDTADQFAALLAKLDEQAVEPASL